MQKGKVIFGTCAELYSSFAKQTRCSLSLLLVLFSLPLFSQNLTIEVVSEGDNTLISQAEIFNETTRETYTDSDDGKFILNDLKTGEYTLVIFAEGFQSKTEIIKTAELEDNTLTISLAKLEFTAEAIEVEAERREYYGLRRLRNVEGMAIYAAKKSEVINLDNLVANLATNNARQVYKGIAGLNIWENDGAGLQLSIGARGLDPNRTSNFNTRQNGYDISADALGYPESYYTPPTQALQRIEIVRGAASLQYGPQFGGLLNFVFKKGNPEKKFEFTSENTVGSWGLLTSFNSVGGQVKNTNYYAFYQRKQGDGWRPNSAFHQNTAFGKVTQKVGKKLTLGAEFTFMNYLAQQPGGLVDFEFDQDPRQSKRSRNFFKVDWNLAAITADYELGEKTKLNSRFFYLDARREALGVLTRINRPDNLNAERDLIRGEYANFGNETRLIHRYGSENRINTFLAGVRYYQGYSETKQGFADNTNQPNFNFLNPEDLELAGYVFPSRNISVFAENLFSINPKWTVTPGLRYEYISTKADGFFKERVLSGGQVIFEQRFDVVKENPRDLLLFGLGTGYKIKEDIEVYANFSQNYRSINFTDLAVVNPNLIVDSLLKDERGFNADLGIRGSIRDFLTFDASIFLLKYQDRIGTGEIQVEDASLGGQILVPYRTNIGDARIHGLEAYAEFDILRFLEISDKKWGLSVFTNFSILEGEYITGASNFIGRKVELIPPYSLKTGFNFRRQNFTAAYQFAWVGKHFSDATNAELTADATRGIIPSYSVHDFSVNYLWKRWKFSGGINNLTDARYFTRRAATYPGPGIIPADGRSFYFTIAVKL